MRPYCTIVGDSFCKGRFFTVSIEFVLFPFFEESRRMPSTSGIIELNKSCTFCEKLQHCVSLNVY